MWFGILKTRLSRALESHVMQINRIQWMWIKKNIQGKKTKKQNKNCTPQFIPTSIATKKVGFNPKTYNCWCLAKFCMFAITGFFHFLLCTAHHPMVMAFLSAAYVCECTHVHEKLSVMLWGDFVAAWLCPCWVVCLPWSWIPLIICPGHFSLLAWVSSFL